MKGLLKDNFPELVKEWDFEKNTVPFDTITCGSGYRAFWKCVKGHGWDTDICSRVSKRAGAPTQCPKCQRKRVKPEDKLGFRFPELIKEWHPKNDVSIDVVSHASNKEYWWICGKGHEWEANPNDRANKGNGCPFCSGRVAAPETSLAFRFPELLKEWDYERNKLDPNHVTYGSGSKVWWICGRGHCYPAVVCDRTSKRHQNGCPKCTYYKSSKMELFVYCEIKYYYPDALHRHKLDNVECDIYIPSTNIGIEVDGGLWHKGREVMDENKFVHFAKLGVTLISVREVGLGIFNPHTVVYPKSYSLFSSISKPLISLLVKILNDERLINYQYRKQPVNTIEYNNMIKDYPLNGFGKIAQKVRNKPNKI